MFPDKSNNPPSPLQAHASDSSSSLDEFFTPPQSPSPDSPSHKIKTISAYSNNQLIRVLNWALSSMLERKEIAEKEYKDEDFLGELPDNGQTGTPESPVLKLRLIPPTPPGNKNSTPGNY